MREIKLSVVDNVGSSVPNFLLAVARTTTHNAHHRVRVLCERSVVRSMSDLPLI